MHTCYYCPSEFEEYKELAIHINTCHANKHNKWAANFVLKRVLFKEQDKNDNRIPLSEEEKEAKRSTQRSLSGVEKPVQTLCPTCQNLGLQFIPIEYVTSNSAWRKNGKLVVMCSSCRSRK